MQLEWISNPVTPYAALAVTLLLCLWVLISLKLEISRVRREALARAAAAGQPAPVPGAGEALAPVLQPAVAEASTPETAAPDGVFSGQELNLTRRARALRMQRRGEEAPTIAAALRLPRNEVDLLLKIEKLTNDYGASRTVGA